MADKYSKFGPAPRTPSSMQRSYLLSIDFKVTSITEWAAQLKINPLYAILSGFEPDNTPRVGTFYDFINRLWNSDDDHISPHIHPLKTKVKKPKTKGTSTRGLALNAPHLLRKKHSALASCRISAYLSALLTPENLQRLFQSMHTFLSPNHLAHF